MTKQPPLTDEELIEVRAMISNNRFINARMAREDKVMFSDALLTHEEMLRKSEETRKKYGILAISPNGPDLNIIMK